MEMPQYSPEDIIASRSLQTYTYMYASMAAFWTYDYICSLDKEWTFLLESRWTKVKGLYIVTRHVPFLFFTVHLYMNFVDETHDKCHVRTHISECFSIVSAVCSEWFFILRTYALWNHNRIVLSAMVSFFIAIMIASVSVIFTSNIPAPFYTSPIPGITGCYQTSVIQLLVSFLLSLALGLGLLILTLTRAIQNWRSTNGPLFVILVKHNIEYYACSLVFSILNIFACLFFIDAYGAMFRNFQLIILVIVATRMHLHLWHTDQHLRGSETLIIIPMSEEISFRGIGLAGSDMESGVRNVGLDW